ncbi:sugar ABC transporter substrate-binding protein [Lachnospiraceae bacterium LCP25S3_G4]
MKKKVLSAIICVVMVATMVMGCQKSTKKEADSGDAAEKKDSYTVGVTIQSLENDYWAGVFGEVETMLKDKGWDYTIIDCKDNSATQISQIENFITAGVDLIMVHPSDPTAIEEVCKQALDAGIKVMCWDDKMENTTANWVLDNTELGKTIGTPAADFINEHYSTDNKAEVCVIGYPQTPILLERENGIKEALKGAEGKYEIVASIDGLEANDAQTNVETVLQAYPNCKVFATIGAGSDIGANQALLTKYNNKIPEDCGIFSGDATETQLKAIKSGVQASNTTVGFEGSNTRTAKACVEMYEKILSGEKFEDKNVFRPFVVINSENVDEYLADYK